MIDRKQGKKFYFSLVENMDGGSQGPTTIPKAVEYPKASELVLKTQTRGLPPGAHQ